MPFGRSVGSLLASFWSLWRLFGVPGSSFWLSLACLSRLWALSSTFYGAFVSSGLSVGSGTGPVPLFAPFGDHFETILEAFSEEFGG